MPLLLIFLMSKHPNCLWPLSSFILTGSVYPTTRSIFVFRKSLFDAVAAPTDYLILEHSVVGVIGYNFSDISISLLQQTCATNRDKHVKVSPSHWAQLHKAHHRNSWYPKMFAPKCPCATKHAMLMLTHTLCKGLGSLAYIASSGYSRMPDATMSVL